MSNIEWGPENQESPEAVEAALANVHAEGDKRKTRRRSLAGGVAVFAALALLAVSVESAELNGVQDNDVVAIPPQTPPTTELFQPTLASHVLDRAADALATTNTLSYAETTTEYCLPGATSNMEGCEPTVTETKSRLDSDGNSWSHSEVIEPAAKYPLERVHVTTPQLSEVLENTDPNNVNKGSATFVLNRYPGTGPGVLGDTALTYSAMLNELSKHPDATLEKITYKGDPAWRISTRASLYRDDASPIEGHLSVVFDATTFYPMAARQFYGGELWRSTVTTELKFDPPFSPADFRIDPPKGTRVEVHDDPSPSQKVDSLKDLKMLTGYEPLALSELPDGYALSSIHFQRNGPSSGVEQRLNYNRDVVLVVYRRGLQSIELTTRLAGDELWDDPLGAAGDDEASFVVHGGVYDGIDAHLVTGALTRTHVWAEGETVVTTLRAELMPTEIKELFGSIEEVR